MFIYKTNTKRESTKLKAEMTGDDILLFIDVVHPTQATKVTSGWIRTSVDQIIKKTRNRIHHIKRDVDIAVYLMSMKISNIA